LGLTNTWRRCCAAEGSPLAVFLCTDEAGTSIFFSPAERCVYEGGAKLTNQLGKRYLCENWGTEMIITKGGEGTLKCCGQPMVLKQK